MKYFKLTPKEEILNDVLWKVSSTHFEPTIIQASDEDEARKIAEMNYGISYGNSLKTCGIWQNKDYVDVTEIDESQFRTLRHELKPLYQEVNIFIANSNLH